MEPLRRGHSLKRGLAFLLLTAWLGQPALADEEVNAVDLEALQSRLGAFEQMDSVDFSRAHDVRTMLADLTGHPARAALKYGKPALYRGRIRIFLVPDGRIADLVLEDGSRNGATVVLFPVQPSEWVKRDGQWGYMALASTLEFAAAHDKGDELYFQCKQLIPRAEGLYLHDCLAFPPQVALELFPTP